MMIVMIAAGNAIGKFSLNLSFILQPCVFVAAIVVSEMKERLSPNIEPPITAPTQSGRLRSAPRATFIATGTITEIVPHDVPIAIETIHAITNSPTIAKSAGMIESSRFAALVAPPAPCATPLNAPAIRKMNSIVVMFSSPMLVAQIFIFSSKSRSLFCMKATTRPNMNATTADIM